MMKSKSKKTPATKSKKPAASKSRSAGTRTAGKKSVRGKMAKAGKAAPKRKALRKLLPLEPVKPAENPEAKKLAQDIASLILDKKALNVVILDVRGMTSYADYFVLGSGESERQVTAMAEHVSTQLKEQGKNTYGFEGFETGRWVLLDYGEVVAHLFFDEVREFYDLEGLWADAPRERVA